MKARYILATVAILVVMIFAVNSCSGGGDGDGDESDITEQIPAFYNEKEITSDGGSISIIDEYNNVIEVTFPKDALSKTTLISLGVLSEQPDLPIETWHVSAFEIKPYNTELYKPVFVMATYENTVQDINRTALFRKKTDSLLVPLANHKHFDNKTVRAEAFILGVFAEGKMSLDQINNQIDLLLASKEISLDQKNATANENPIDSTCYTEITKAIWDDWKETAWGTYELFEMGQWMGFPYDVEEWDSICTNIASAGGQMVLDRCIPENICDHNYRYTILDALITIQRLGCIENNEIYTQLSYRLWDIETKCIKDGALVIDLSALEVKSQPTGPETPYYSQVHMVANGVAPLSIVEVHASGFADIMDIRTEVFVVSGGGFVVYNPNTSWAMECQIDVSGYIKVDVTGNRDSLNVFNLIVSTSHYIGQTEVCPSSTTTSPVRHTKNRFFEVILSDENDYSDTTTADRDPEWKINAELLLP